MHQFIFSYAGDKSEVIDVENPDLNKYPNFSQATPYRCLLLPGDVLYIPGTLFISVFSYLLFFLLYQQKIIIW